MSQGIKSDGGSAVDFVDEFVDEEGIDRPHVLRCRNMWLRGNHLCLLRSHFRMPSLSKQLVAFSYCLGRIGVIRAAHTYTKQLE